LLAFLFMDIHLAAKYMNLGYRIRRPDWNANMFLDSYSMIFKKLVLAELLAEDWEVITQGIIKDFPITYQE
jgi:hypothetical protein